MKKILFIGHESDLNGASKSLLNIISELENSNRIYVLTSFSNGDFYEELRKHNVTILVYPFFRWSIKKHCSTLFARNEINWIKRKLIWNLKESKINERTASIVSDIVKKEGIEIIHSNTGVINIGAMIKNKVGSSVKHVWHIREFGDLDFDMYPLVGQRKYIEYMNKNTDKFICISDAVFNHYSDLSKEKKIVIYNGIDKSNKIIEHKSHDGINFLISGRISETKGQKEAVEACIILLEKGYTNFKLYIAGAGKIYFDIPEKYKDYFVLLGNVSDMPQLRKDMDIELVCSRAEAFGRVTAEAMMGGIPVIGSNTGGTPELIVDGKTGFLYEYCNKNDLAKKMLYFLRNPSEISKMGSEAQKYAMEKFTIERCVSEIYSCY